MKWGIQYLPEVEKDLKALSHNQVISVRKALEKDPNRLQNDTH